MPEPEILLPSGPETPLLDQPREEKLRREVESLRRELEQERERNHKKKEEKSGAGHPKKRTLWFIGLGLAILLIAAFFPGFLPHYRREKQLRQDARAEAKALPILTYIFAQRSGGETQLILPGSVEALTEAPVLAGADGYLKRRYVDIGDRVKLGQLPADITAPDQQVQQARAQLLQARAALRQSNAPLEQARANQTLENSTLTTGASNLVNRSPNRNCSPVPRWQEASL